MTPTGIMCGQVSETLFEFFGGLGKRQCGAFHSCLTAMYPFVIHFSFYQTSLLTLFHLFFSSFSFLLFSISTLAAAIVRKVYLRQGTGVGALKNRFGGAYRRGARPEVHQDAAGGLIRNILTTLDDLKITEKSSKGGRKVTRTGQQALDLVAGQVARGEV